MTIIDPEQHQPGCTMRLALTCAAAIECEHGCDVCPTCDPCTCDTDSYILEEIEAMRRDGIDVHGVHRAFPIPEAT